VKADEPPRGIDVQHFGHTRSVQRANYVLQAPDSFVRAALPGMKDATAVVHVSPANGARFVQYTAELQRGGRLGTADDQRFLYVLDGELTVGGTSLGPEDYAYIAPGDECAVVATTSARAAVVEKPYEALDGRTPPTTFTGRERLVAAVHLNDDPWLEVRGLIPDDAAFDFRMGTMAYRPGAGLSAVEMHVMEHGLLMLAGGGIYRLGDDWHPVQAGDFIWMAAYCPQWFGAIGKTGAKYLIYKDWDRHPRAAASGPRC
jgi:(S)-ureidoglycine aminohydrolase